MNNLPPGVTDDMLEGQLYPEEFLNDWDDYYQSEGFTMEVAYEMWLQDKKEYHADLQTEGGI